MSKKQNKTILIIGILGGVVIIFTILIIVIISALSSFSEPEVSEQKVQFSVVQPKNEAPQQGARTLEQANAAYEAGERRIEQAEREAERQSTFATNTSFGFRVNPPASPVKPEPTLEQEKPKVTSRTTSKPKPKAKSQLAPNSQPVVEEQPVATVTSTPRRKRTSFDEPATDEAQQQPAAANSIKFRGRIFEDVEITSTSNVRIRVLEEFTYNGCVVKRNTLLPAVASRGSNNITISIQNMIACGDRMTVNFHGHSLDGNLGLSVREDGAAEAGVREGGSSAVSGAANAAATRAGGVLGIVGSAVASGISGGTRTAQSRKPVLLEEGRELLFIGG